MAKFSMRAYITPSKISVFTNRSHSSALRHACQIQGYPNIYYILSRNMDQSGCFATPIIGVEYSSNAGKYLNAQRTFRYEAANGVATAYPNFSKQRISGPISEQYKCKIWEILGNLPDNDDLRDSVHAKRFDPIYTQARTLIKPGKARVLLYGPTGCGKLTLVLKACAESRSFPYIISLASMRDQATQAALGFMLSLEDRRPPTLVVTDCGLMDDACFTLLNTLTARNSTTNIVGVVSSLPRHVTILKALFSHRFLVQQDDFLVDDVILELDDTNKIFQQHQLASSDQDKFGPVINSLCSGLTIGTIASVYKSAISNTMDTISTIPLFQSRNIQGVIFDCAADTAAVSLNNEGDNILPHHLVANAKECFVLAIIQGLLKAPLHSLQGYEVYR